MFSLFKKKSNIDRLQKKYESAMKEAHRLSQIDRRKGDEKYAEAQSILEEIEKLS